MSGSPSSSRWRTRLPSSDDNGSSIEEVTPTTPAPAGPSRYEPQQLIARREEHQKELDRLGEEMQLIQERCKHEKKIIDELTRQLSRGNRDAAVKDYFGSFKWSGRLREQMVRVFGIGEFRLSQEGVCNASMDRRDIICIMPTGGGKSLTYQLPATLVPGCTLVVSPLVALIKDQNLHLQEKQVECLTFTAKMPQAKITEGYNRLRDPTTGKEVKLCFVTPERLIKSDEFRSIMKAMVASNKLARIVIDEAHCIPQLGRDFRPQYRELADLRKLYPGVPILALSATCRHDVLRDLVAILNLPPLTHGAAAEQHGTVLFQSPLYRKNLHYKVLPKSSDRTGAIREMAKYILERHPNETGIVYCLSREDARRVATKLDHESEGKIKTGFYHAEIDDKVKEDLHESWLMGKVKVMCATTAFGLGINKADVRFVLHHSMPKSLDTFYQESGRAGRDGKDADCILHYRLLDALRTAGMRARTDWQQEEAHGMIRFCLDLKECRKSTFTKHFSSTDFSSAEDNTPCGHCDNCLRDPATVVQKDVTSEAKRMLAIARALASRNTDFTAVQLARTARGNGDLAKQLNLSRSDKVTLSPLDTEALIAHLLLEGYLEKFTIKNSYTVQVYLKPAHSRSFGEDQKLVVQLQLVPNDHSPRKKRSRPHKAAEKRLHKDNNNDNNDNEEEEVEEEEDEEDDFGDLSGEDGESDPAGPSENAGGSPAKRRRSSHHHQNGSPTVITIDIEDSDQEPTGIDVPSALPATSRPLTRSWRRRAKAQKQKQGGQGRLGTSRRATPSGATAALLDDDVEVIEISTD